MDHIAILNKRWILEKIISGEKEVESRWYTQRRTPYKNIHKDDNIYFKESGCPIIAKAQVEKTLFFEDLNKDKIKHILNFSTLRMSCCLNNSGVKGRVNFNFITLKIIKSKSSMCFIIASTDLTRIQYPAYQINIHWRRKC